MIWNATIMKYSGRVISVNGMQRIWKQKEYFKFKICLMCL